MDGNRRYGAAAHGDPLRGHADGGKVLADFVEWCVDAGVAALTVFAFSTENWRRERREVDLLMDTLCEYCDRFRKDAVARNVRIRGLMTSAHRLPPSVLEAVANAERDTAACTGLVLNICLSYGGREELAGACRRIAEDVQSGAMAASSIDEDAIRDRLLTRHVGDPDVLIRTSGERRVSNFLLFQLAYTELFFLEKHWPEVTRDDLSAVFDQYRARRRRYGR
ncbi:Decaprenyl diphosphate synthase-like protein [Tribonema minus]|uniref:Alkyl transferase n=1 Tax=Tribonema minus TaxID=303371 RepID=A0A836CC83_9STRA|nr:Decaprenyl diphosphate synthase-like protein [Tribonema minus]